MNAFRPLALAVPAAIFALVLVQPGIDGAAGAAARRGPVVYGGRAIISHLGAASTSTNWSGYAVTGGTFSYVHGSWKVPTATCASGENSQSSTWVGLDGWGSNTVEQTGSVTGCIFGVPTYIPWFEMYPALPVPLSEPMSPGDSMTASVTESGGGTSYLLVLTDHTKNWTYKTTQAASPADQDASAEWITERPSCPIFCNNLTNFGSVTWSGATAAGNGQKGPISSFAGYKAVNMNNGNLEASVGPLSTSGAGFTDRWHHA